MKLKQDNMLLNYTYYYFACVQLLYGTNLTCLSSYKTAN